MASAAPHGTRSETLAKFTDGALCQLPSEFRDILPPLLARFSLPQLRQMAATGRSNAPTWSRTPLLLVTDRTTGSSRLQWAATCLAMRSQTLALLPQTTSLQAPPTLLTLTVQRTRTPQTCFSPQETCYSSTQSRFLLVWTRAPRIFSFKSLCGTLRLIAKISFRIGGGVLACISKPALTMLRLRCGL